MRKYTDKLISHEIRKFQLGFFLPLLFCIIHIDNSFSQTDSSKNHRDTLIVRDFWAIDPKPLYVIKMDSLSFKTDSSFIRKLNPKWIDKIEVLKDAKYKDIYDPPMSEAVILIYIKDRFKKNVGLLIEKEKEKENK